MNRHNIHVHNCTCMKINFGQLIKKKNAYTCVGTNFGTYSGNLHVDYRSAKHSSSLKTKYV